MAEKLVFNPLTGFDLVAKDEVQRGSFAAANNVTVAADVTGLSMSGIDFSTIEVYAVLDATSGGFKKYTLDIYSDGLDYSIAQSQTGPNDINVQFSITTAGQLQYTSDNYPGFVSLDLDWKYLK